MGLPEAFHSRVKLLWQRYVEASGGTGLIGQDIDRDSRITQSLAKVWACSEFIPQYCISHPDEFQALLVSGELESRYLPNQYHKKITACLEECVDDSELMVVLRRLRQREMLRIAWRDIVGWADLDETMKDVSALAEAVIDKILNWLYCRQCDQFGTPCNPEHQPQQMVVLALGKLGAWELNFSSDVDLIFAYPQDGQTQGGLTSQSNSEFFNQLGKQFIKVLSEPMAEGFVFRVDMRLRPFGDSGPLAMNFDAMESYYQIHGRDWERYALIKARVIGGDREAGGRLINMLRPFVYRRYLDFGAFEALRDMKQLIVKEVKRKGLENNIKLGSGGIREVEFIGQAFQLIRGGQEPLLQERRILQVLECLFENGYLPEYVVQDLKQAYIFLRTLEHRLQEFADQQTHTLPDNDEGRLRIAYAMGFMNWPAFTKALNKHQTHVRGHFEQVFAAPQTDSPDTLDLEGVWLGTLDVASAKAVLLQAGYAKDSEEMTRRLSVLRNSRAYSGLSAQGRQRMDKLLPLLLAATGQVQNSNTTAIRLLELVEAVTRRSVYLALLGENPMALSQLVKLCSASPWVARYLTQHPALLDELLDPRTLYAPPDQKALRAELQAQLSHWPEDDLEQIMITLCHFKQTNVLRVAAADISGGLPLMKISDHLSWIAEQVMDEVLELVWAHLIERHGRPACKANGQLCDKGFAVIAYGKLGGYELGYGSDLDLVFLHGGESPNLMTQGEQALAIPVFFARMGQRIIHILTAHTPAGVLYEVDMRLRPDGASGMLVSSLNAYRAYQRDKAWIWEHQALVRARVVAGDPVIAKQFAAIRAESLMRSRDKVTLRKEICEMRERMRIANSKSKSGQFDLKQDKGGIVDIEFMVQYGVLAWASGYPALLDFTDNIQLLEGFVKAGKISAEEAAYLSDAYRTYRDRLHRLILQEQMGIIPGQDYRDFKAGVVRLWQRWMED